MKEKRNILRTILGVAVLLAIALLSDSLADASAITIMTGAGVAMTSVDTQKVAASTSARFNREDISRKVTEMLPARTPLDTILRQIRDAEKIDSQIKTYYSVSSKPLYDVINSGASGDGVTTGAKAYVYASGNGLTTFKMAIANSALWAADDTFLLRNVAIPATKKIAVMAGLSGAQIIYVDIAFYVHAVDNGVLTVEPLNGIENAAGNDFVMPDFAETAILYRMGPAKNELAAQTRPFGIIPEPDTNFVQYFMAQVEESIFQRMTIKEADWNFSDIERQNLYSLRAEIEMSHLFGVKGVVTNNVANDKRYTTEGIVRRMTKRLTYGTGGADRSMTQADYLAWMKSLFVGNNGSLERIIFGGSNFIAGLHTVEDVSKQLDAKNVEVKWGLKFNSIVTNFGSLLVMHHPLLSATGMADYGLALDMEHVHKHEFLPMEVTELDLVTSGQRKSNAKVIAEASCTTLTFPDCHALIGPKA
jgi:hypothetical protein